MDKNSIIGLVLIALLLIGYSIWTAPTEEQMAAQRRAQDSIVHIAQQHISDSLKNVQQQAEVKKDTVATPGSDSLKSIELQQQYGSFANAVNGTEKDFLIENDLMRITLSNKGGKIKQVMLKKYRTWDQKPLLLYYADSSSFGLNFFADNKPVSTNDLFFDAQNEAFKVTGSNKNSFTMRLSAGEGRYVDYIYSLDGNSYNLKFNIQFNNLNSVIAQNATALELDWREYLMRQEKTIKAEHTTSTIMYRLTDETVNDLGFTSDKKETPNEKIKWVAFKQQFFSSVLIADQTFSDPILEETTDPNNEDLVKYMKANVRIPFDHKPQETFASTFYLAPIIISH